MVRAVYHGMEAAASRGLGTAAAHGRGTAASWVGDRGALGARDSTYLSSCPWASLASRTISLTSASSWRAS